MTPYEAAYGIKLLTLLSYVPKTARLQKVEDSLFARVITLQILKDNITHAREKMKLAADKHRTPREFQINDWVHLRLQQAIDSEF